LEGSYAQERKPSLKRSRLVSVMLAARDGGINHQHQREHPCDNGEITQKRHHLALSPGESRMLHAHDQLRRSVRWRGVW
jgi:hypothetical protein